MKFLSVVREVKAKTDRQGAAYVELKLDAIACHSIDLEEAKALLGKKVRVEIERLDAPLPGLEITP